MHRSDEATATATWSQAIQVAPNPYGCVGHWNRPCQSFWKFRVLVDTGYIHLVLGQAFYPSEIRACKVRSPQAALKIRAWNISLEVWPSKISLLEACNLKVSSLDSRLEGWRFGDLLPQG